MAREIAVDFLLPGKRVGGGFDSWRDVADLARAMGVCVRPADGLSAADLDRLRPVGLTLDDMERLAADRAPDEEVGPVPQKIGPEERTIAVGVNGTAT